MIFRRMDLLLSQRCYFCRILYVLFPVDRSDIYVVILTANLSLIFFKLTYLKDKGKKNLSANYFFMTKDILET